MAQLALAFAGAYIGGSLFGTALAARIGWAIGSYLGARLFAPDLPDVEGPRLSDLQVTSGADYGTPITKVWGTVRVSCPLIWAAPIKERAYTTEVGGGKGGGGSQKVTNYKYFADFAVYVCEGPVLSVSRIWADSVLLFDGRKSINGFRKDYSDYSEHINLDLGKATVYYGTEDQMPDSLIESTEGVGNVSANRGICYIVFGDLALEKFGNRIPSIRVEVTKDSLYLQPILINRTPNFWEYTVFSDRYGVYVTIWPSAGGKTQLTIHDRKYNIIHTENLLGFQINPLMFGLFYGDKDRVVFYYSAGYNRRVFCYSIGQRKLLFDVHIVSAGIYDEWYGFGFSFIPIYGKEQLVIATFNNGSSSIPDAYHGVFIIDPDTGYVSQRLEEDGDEPDFAAQGFENLSGVHVVGNLAVRDERYIYLSDNNNVYKMDVLSGSVVAKFSRVTTSITSINNNERSRQDIHNGKVYMLYLDGTDTGIEEFDINSESFQLQEWSKQYMSNLTMRFKDGFQSEDGTAFLANVIDDYSYVVVILNMNSKTMVAKFYTPDPVYVGTPRIGESALADKGSSVFISHIGANTKLDIVSLQEKGNTTLKRICDDVESLLLPSSNIDNSDLEVEVKGCFVSKEMPARAFLEMLASIYNVSFAEVDGKIVGTINNYPMEFYLFYKNLNLAGGWPDYSGNGNNANSFFGTIQRLSGTTLTDHTSGFARFLSSSGANVECHSSTMSAITKDFSIEAWIRINSLTGTMAIASQDTSDWTANPSWQLRITSAGTPEFIIYTGGGTIDAVVLTSPSVLSNSNWHQVAATYDGTTMKIFVDGALTASKPFSGSIAAGSTPITIFASYYNDVKTDFMDGDLDMFMFLNRSFKDEEIAYRWRRWTYQSIRDVTESDLVNDISITKRSIREQPSRVSLIYLDSENDFQQAEQHVDFPTKREAIGSNNVSLDVPIAMTAKEAASIVERIAADEFVGKELFSFSLPHKFIEISPGDYIKINLDNGEQYFAKVLKSIIDANSISLDAVREQQNIFSRPPGQVSYDSATYTSVAHSFLELIDTARLDDIDDEPGFYALSGPMFSNGSWSNAFLYQSSDGVNYNLISTFPSAATVAILVEDTTSGPSTVWDDYTSIKVSLISGTLVSAADADVLNGANLAYLNGELLQFSNVTDNGDGTYTLTRLLRGRKGTEHSIAAHTKGSRLVVLGEDAASWIDATVSSIGKEKFYKSVTNGLLLQDAIEKKFSYQGIDLKPLSPVHIKFSASGGSIKTTWIRRTRINGEWKDLSDVPIGEAYEKYKVEIYRSGSLIDSNDVTTPEYTYNLQVGDVVKIYQYSDRVGLGYPAEATFNGL